MAAVLLFELRACLCHRCAVVLGTQPITRSNTRASTIPSCDQLMTQSTQRQNKASFKMDPAQGPESSVLSASYISEGYVLFIFVFWLYNYLVDVRGFSISILKGGLIHSLPCLTAVAFAPLGGRVRDLLSTRSTRLSGVRWVIMFGY